MSRLPLSQVFSLMHDALSSCFFLYGNNDGLIQGVLREIEECFSFCHIPFDTIEEHFAFLNTPLLWGKKPVVTFITEGVVVKKIKPFFDKWPKGFFLVVVSKNKQSDLENYKNVKTVPCYETTHKESLFILNRYALRRDLVLDPEIMSFCAEHARQGSWFEWIAFLSVYPKEKITMDLVSDYAFLLSESQNGPLSESSFLEGLSFFKMNAVQRTLLQSRWLKGRLVSNRLEEAKKDIYPSVFFKDMQKVVQLAQQKTFPGLLEKMERSLFLELIMKKNRK